MAVCGECGVELEEEVLSCPLCGTLLGGPSHDPIKSGTPEPASQSDIRVQWVVWEVASIFLGSAAAVVFAADFAFTRGTTWSLIPLASLCFLWLSATAIILVGRRVLLVLLLETISLLLLLAVLDRATPGRPWFLFPIAPIAVLAAVLTSLIVFLTRIARLSPLSIVALSLLAAGVFLVGTEAGLSFFLTNTVLVSWSMLTLACILPPSLVLLFLQRRLRNSGPEIKKRFHL